MRFKVPQFSSLPATTPSSGPRSTLDEVQLPHTGSTQDPGTDPSRLSSQSKRAAYVAPYHMLMSREREHTLGGLLLSALEEEMIDTMTVEKFKRSEHIVATPPFLDQSADEGGGRFSVQWRSV